MSPALASDLFRAALMVALQVVAPLLCVMATTAVVFGVLQAATQVQDASISFTPKLGAALVVMWLGAPWISTVLSSFLRKALVAIPLVVAR